ncbi:MAG: hypothetical protein M4579_004261 [Chaenotheca gracillima]|nr:MAG: hypothetical protein M4579_004261 [Chaenotheca gracillima]
MRIRRGIADDLPTVASVGADAFREDILFALLNPGRHGYPNDFREGILRRSQMRFYTPGCHLVVAETDERDSDFTGTHEIMGYAWWEREGTSNAARAWQLDPLENKLERLLLNTTRLYYNFFNVDKSQDLAAVRELDKSFPNIMKGTNEHWDLAVLGVAPAFQRRGVGAQLVSWGLEVAEREGVPVALAASPIGQRLYRKMGFREFGTMNIVEGETTLTFIWEPEGMKGKWGQMQI